MRALRASAGYVGRILRLKFPSLMCEMRSGAIFAVGTAAGKTGRASPNRLGTPRRSPMGALPEFGPPNPPTVGTVSSPMSGVSLGIRVGILRVMVVGLFGVIVVSPIMRVLTAGGSPNGCPKLTGVESEWNEGKPAGRNREKSSSVPATRPCNANDVKADNPRRERSSQDVLIVSSNIASSEVECG